MKRIALALMLGLSAGLVGLAPSIARATPIESDIRQFEKGKAKLDEVVAKLGKPDRSERNDEGLKAIGYLAPGKTVDAKTSLFPAAGTSPDPAMAAIFVFDKAGRLVHYSGNVPPAGTISSEDGAGPMPNINAFIDSVISQKSIDAMPSDGKPRLGIQFIPTSDTDAQHQKDFAAAKFEGMIVVKVLVGSPARKAGIRRNDYIYLLNGYYVASFDDVVKAMAGVQAGQLIRIHAARIDQATNQIVDQVFDIKF